MIYQFKKIKTNDIPWESLEQTFDSTPYKTKRWSNFLMQTQHVKPYVVEVTKNDNIIGFFYGQKIRKLFIPMIVSPFEGWTTSFQGLSMLTMISKVERVEIYKQLINFLFKTHECLFFQASDWQLEIDDVKNKLEYEIFSGYRLDLTQEFSAIYKNFKDKSCKYSIHKAQKQGIIIKRATDVVSFSNNYYKQLVEVFSKQGLKPTYDLMRVINLCNTLYIGKDLFLFEVYLPDGKTCIATGLFIMDNNLAVYYGAASYHEYQKMCPNELLMYEAIKTLHESGIKEIEFGGGRKYKEKYGPIPYAKPKIIASKYTFLIIGKNKAKSLYYGTRRFRAILKKIFKPNFRN